MARAAYRATAWSTSAYRKARLEVLAESDICGICGHGGATTTDHIITLANWPKDENGRLLPGHDAKENLQPAHGTMGAGPTRTHNPCPICARLCNQSRKGAQAERPRHSRMW